jgi:hypothetical protein
MIWQRERSMCCDSTREAMHERLFQFLLHKLHNSNRAHGRGYEPTNRLVLIEPLVERIIDIIGHGF